MTTTTTTISTTPVIQQPVKKESHVTESSLLALTEGRPIVVSYGYTNAGWNETNEAMKRILGEDNVWNYMIGENLFPHRSSSGAPVTKIHVPEVGTEGLAEGARGSIKLRRQCKAGLINTIFHNYCMIKNGKDDFVPIIFSTSLSYASGVEKLVEKNSRTTCSEIEILRKLCTDEALPEDFRIMARQSVKFIDVRDEYVTDVCEDLTTSPDFVRQTTYSFRAVDAPWEVGGYAQERERVKATWLGQNLDFERPEGSKGTGEQAFKWKEQLLGLAEPGMGFIPEIEDEVEPEAQEDTTTDVEVAPEFPTATPTSQEEATPSVPVTQETETVDVSEG